MKKLYILFLLVITISFNLKSATYTSSQNGNWMSVTTWSPFGIPIPGDIIIINHTVTLDTSFAYSTGSITVNSAGSLIQDLPVRDIWLNGVNTSFTNNGTTTIRHLLLSAGSFSNAGNFNVKSIANYITANNTTTGNLIGLDSLYNDGTLNNNGTLNVMTFYNNNTINNYGTIQGLTTVVDSMMNVGTFLNDVGALLKADSCTNTNTFTNNGVINFSQFTNTGTFTNTNYMSFVDMTNIGTYTNQDSLIGIGSATNTGNLDNQAGAHINLGVSFLNADTVNFNATYTANGSMVIGDSFFNFDSISGNAPGSILLQDTSYNGGTMSGNFDFCDLTPNLSLPPPYVDINVGTVDSNIVFCVWVGVSMNEQNITNFIYPNPTNGILNIKVEKNISIEVYNVLGEQIITTSNTKIDLSSYKNGIYFIFFRDELGNLINHEKIVKQ